MVLLCEYFKQEMNKLNTQISEMKHTISEFSKKLVAKDLIILRLKAENQTLQEQLTQNDLITNARDTLYMTKISQEEERCRNLEDETDKMKSMSLLGITKTVHVRQIRNCAEHSSENS